MNSWKSKAVSTVVTLSGLLCLIAPPSAHADDLSAGKFLYYNNDARKALEYFDHVLDREKNNAEALLYKGLAYIDMRNFEKAIPPLTRCIEIERHEREVFAKNRVLKNNINFLLAELYQNRGYAYVELRQYKPAIDDLSEAIKLRPNYKVNYYNRAKAYDRMGQNVLALKDRMTASKLPNLETALQRPAALVETAEVLVYRHQYEKAVVNLNRALIMDPNCLAAYRLRIKVFLKQHKPDLALKDCSSVLKWNPKDAEVMADMQEAKQMTKAMPREDDDDLRFAN